MRKFHLRTDASCDTRCSHTLNTQLPRVIAEGAIQSSNGWAEFLAEPKKFLVDMLNYAHWPRMLHNLLTRSSLSFHPITIKWRTPIITIQNTFCWFQGSIPIYVVGGSSSDRSSSLKLVFSFSSSSMWCTNSLCSCISCCSSDCFWNDASWNGQILQQSINQSINQPTNQPINLFHSTYAVYRENTRIFIVQNWKKKKR